MLSSLQIKDAKDVLIHFLCLECWKDADNIHLYVNWPTIIDGYGTRKSDFGHYPINHIILTTLKKKSSTQSQNSYSSYFCTKKYIKILVAYTNKAQILEIRHWTIISSNKSSEFNPILSRVQLKNYKHHYIILLLYIL